MALNLLNLYSLIISQFDKIHGMSCEMTDYFNNLTSHKSLDSLGGDTFERPSNIPLDKDVVYCFRKCYKNSTITTKSLFISSLVLNSSFLAQENTSNTIFFNKPITAVENSTIPTSNSLYLEENTGNDYPNYNEYFVEFGETDFSINTNPTPYLTPIQNYRPESASTSFEDKNDTDKIRSTTIDVGIFENVTYPTSSISPKDLSFESNEEDEKDKYADYLSYILSSIDARTTDLDESLNGSNASSTIPSDATTSITTEELDTSISPYDDSTFEVEESTTVSSIDVSSSIISDVTESITTEEVISSISSYQDSSSKVEGSTTADMTEPSTYSTNGYIPESTVEETETSCDIGTESPEEATLCEWVCEEEKPINMTEVGYLIRKMNNTDRKKLRALCWETMFGQDLIKLTVMDLIMTFLSTMAVDFFRAIFVRVMNNCWCWDLEKRFPKYSDFKVAENILHLVNNQGMIWMGLFFSPGLAIVNVVKLLVLMYLRAWTVLTCNVPPEVIFRASKSNNFYYTLLLMMLFLCTLPVGYAMVVLEPSWYCGPFSGYKRMYTILTSTITKITPRSFDNALQYAVSPGSIIPLLVLLILFIYYLTSLTSSLREANAELKLQLRRERTEERRKVFQLVDRRRRVGSAGSDPNNPFNKWKKLLSTFPTGKSIEDSGRLESFDQSQSESAKEGKDFFSKLIKRALGKASHADNNNYNKDDASDLDQQDSLPHDVNRNNDNEVAIPQRRTSSTTSRNLRQLVAILSTNKEKEEIKNDSPIEDSINENISNTAKNEGSNRQESVSSNWSDNIPVITISNIEQADNTKGEKNIRISNNSPDVVGKDKFKPKVKYALKKQSTEIDEESIRHFHREIMKQRSHTLVHDSCYRDENIPVSSSPTVDNKTESKQKIETTKVVPKNDEAGPNFINVDSNDSSFERKDSVFY